MALGRPGVITTLQVTGLALTVPLMLLLIPRFGIVGAGVALLLSTMARLVFVLASFPVFLKIRIPSLLLKFEDLRFAWNALGTGVGRCRRVSLAAAGGTD